MQLLLCVEKLLDGDNYVRGEQVSVSIPSVKSDAYTRDFTSRACMFSLVNSSLAELLLEPAESNVKASSMIAHVSSSGSGGSTA